MKSAREYDGFNFDEEDGKYDDVGLDLSEMWHLFLKKIWLIIGCMLLCGGAAGIGAKILIPTTYQSTAIMFLTPRVNEGIVDANSISSNQQLVANVMELITQDNIMSTVATAVGMPSSSDVKDTISVSNDTGTQLIDVSVITTNPELSKSIAETTVNTFINTMSSSLDVSNIEVVSPAKVNYDPVGPNISKMIMYGAIFSLCISLFLIFMKVVTDNRLKSKEAAEAYLKVPVFIELPDLEK